MASGKVKILVDPIIRQMAGQNVWGVVGGGVEEVLARTFAMRKVLSVLG